MPPRPRLLVPPRVLTLLPRDVLTLPPRDTELVPRAERVLLLLSVSRVSSDFVLRPAIRVIIGCYYNITCIWVPKNKKLT